MKEVKQKFGTNSVHVEFSGDGSFISSLPQVKKATVYENYAEMQLNGDLSSRELLVSIASKVEIRKFEFVEPSLNSIFLEVVGMPDEAQERRESSGDFCKDEKPLTATSVCATRCSCSVVALLATLVLSVITLKKRRYLMEPAGSSFGGVGVLVRQVSRTYGRQLPVNCSARAEEVSHAK